jgi:hypothetical protein
VQPPGRYSQDLFEGFKSRAFSTSRGGTKGVLTIPWRWLKPRFKVGFKVPLKVSKGRVQGRVESRVQGTLKTFKVGFKVLKVPWRPSM